MVCAKRLQHSAGEQALVRQRLWVQKLHDRVQSIKQSHLAQPKPMQAGEPPRPVRTWYAATGAPPSSAG